MDIPLQKKSVIPSGATEGSDLVGRDLLFSHSVPFVFGVYLDRVGVELWTGGAEMTRGIRAVGFVFLGGCRTPSVLRVRVLTLAFSSNRIHANFPIFFSRVVRYLRKVMNTSFDLELFVEELRATQK